MLIEKNVPGMSYGMNCQQLSITTERPALGGMSCTLEPGQESVYHKHHETEVFLILSGKAEITVDGETTLAESGDTILLRPFSGHVIKNLSGEQPVKFMALYWESEVLHVPQEQLPGRVLIFSTPPTPNGDLHLGHMSGPYLAADIYRRFLKQKGIEAVHITGRDDNQTYVSRIAEREMRSPEEVASDYSDKIQTTLNKGNIPVKLFSSPAHSPHHRNEVTAMVRKLYDDGYIIEKDTEEFYDIRTGYSLHEGYIKGTCPHCGAGSDGNACEQCGRPNNCTDLKNPVPTMQNVEMGKRRVKKLYFAMSKLEQQLRSLVLRTNMSSRARQLCVAMLADGLPDICVSNQSPWGIPVEIAGYEDQVVYVWFEMAAGYIAADKEANGDKPYFTDPDARIVHFYGFDNTYYHTLLFPAVYFALNKNLNITEDHVINELLYLRGEKFSTSRRHLIWARKLLDIVPSDYVRWGLSVSRPELKNENFDLDQFIKSTNWFFTEKLAGWVNDSFTHLKRVKDGIVPEAGAWSNQHIQFYGRLKKWAVLCEGAYARDGFSPQAATSILKDIALSAYDFFTVQCRYEQHEDLNNYHRTTLALNFWALAMFARLSAPIIPHIARGLLNAMQLSEALPEKEHSFIQHNKMLLSNVLPSFMPISDQIKDSVQCVD